tara:strand:- start:1445 stop:1744 length:300 start_codon:yes stop_codon:yes gene_type:complete
MSKHITTKLNVFAFIIVLILILNKIDNNNQPHLEQLSKACMTVKSNLPINHTGHPYNNLYVSNLSLWSWLSSDNQSTHLHFLESVELIQVKLNLFNKSA